jgi:hypothetical protein
MFSLVSELPPLCLLKLASPAPAALSYVRSLRLLRHGSIDSGMACSFSTCGDNLRSVGLVSVSRGPFHERKTVTNINPYIRLGIRSWY